MFLGPGDDDDIIDGEWREITRSAKSRPESGTSMFSGCGATGGVLGIAIVILLFGILMALFIEIAPYLMAN